MRALMRHRYLFGFGLSALILVLVGIAILVSTLRFRQDSGWVGHTHDVLRRIETIRSTLTEGIAAQRSYLLTANPEYRRDYARTRTRLRTEIAQLTAAVSDNRTQMPRVVRLGEFVEQRLDSTDEGIRIFEARGLQAAQTYTRNNRGLAVMRRIEALIGQFSAEESKLLETRTARSTHSASILLALGAAGIPLSLAILLWIYLLLSREVAQRADAEARTQQLNARLADSVDDLEQASGDLRELSRYAGMLQSCRNVSEALDVSRRTLSSLLPDCTGGVYLLRASQDYAELETAWGEHGAVPHALMTPQECWSMRRGQPHCVNDVGEGMVCSHLDPPSSGVASSACLPLTAQGTNTGVLFLSQPSRGPIAHLSVAVAAAEQLSLALSNLRLQESLRQQSIRDALSGLYNRRYLQESLPRELARAQRRGQSLALMMFDLDHFKAFNDSHGHDGGDAILAAFGRLLQSMCREEDIPCRYGGEEFTLILPETELAIAERRAQDIRTAVAVLTVRHLQREIGHLTVSIGLAMAPLHAQDAESLQRLADTALYRAKRAGRNRVEVAEKD